MQNTVNEMKDVMINSMVRTMTQVSVSALLMLVSACGAENPGGAETSSAEGKTEFTKVDSFQPIAEVVAKLGEKHGNENVLLVFDIDSTLLKANQDLGSDHWWKWQSALIKLDPKSEQLVADDFSGLLRAQGLLYAMGGMSLTEDGIDRRVVKWRCEGFRIIALTARGYDFRDATRRELKRNNLDFSNNPGLPASEMAEPFDGYRKSTISAFGLPEETVEKITKENGEPRSVTFSEGVFMAAGQNKGVMLRRLIDRFMIPVKAIVFVDDKDENLVHMQEAFSKTAIEMRIFDFTSEDEVVEAFNQSPERKAQVTEEWRELEKLMDQYFGDSHALSPN